MKLYQHLWGAIKAVLRGNFIIVSPYIKKVARSSLNNPFLPLKEEAGWVWWHVPFISGLGSHRQSNLCEFKANLIYIASSRSARIT